MKNNRFSLLISVFQERIAPEEGYLVGYGAISQAYQLAVPIPEILSLISHKHKQYAVGQWQIFTPRHQPTETLMGHLSFAIKYEGINLIILKKLFEQLDETELSKLISEEPNGKYSRKIWFLYEWQMSKKLSVPDLSVGSYIDLVDDNIQFASHNISKSKRQKINNNLPGVPNFCPMVRKTALLEQCMQLGLSHELKKIIGKIHPDIMARAAAFLLLKDSKASYAIEGEKPAQNRMQRWGRAIGQAGQKPISKNELIRLQQIVIDNPRFIVMGFREQEGFIGEHDRSLGTPIPDHISAKCSDIGLLLEGLIATNEKLENDDSFDAVLAAAIIAFGFVFIHPFVDGNGRIHRYLIHHVLLRKDYVTQGIIFPVSAIILDRINEYRNVLESYSLPMLDLIQWKTTANNNVEILNNTIDLYRYFDATKQVEFLYSCVKETVEQTIPKEVDYLIKYDALRNYLDDVFEMPDRTIALLANFLEQGNGKLSERAKSKEFKELTIEEVRAIENKFIEIFY